MPIVRASERLIYFAHVPKCAGTSVEAYLRERFGSLAFHDPKFSLDVDRDRWSKSSPQHIVAEDLNRLFPPGFFNASFAIVRHPVDRLASAFLFQREIERKIAPDTSFYEWFIDVTENRVQNPFAYDNHIRPSLDFIPENAAVFRLEDGLEPVVTWLDLQVKDFEGPREIGSKNVLSARLEWQKQAPVSLRLSDAERALVHEYYNVDYERFGYDPDAETRY